MKKNKTMKINKTTALISSVIICFIFSFNLNNQTTIFNKIDKNNLKISALTAPISINDLPGSPNDWTWASSQTWFGGGSGTSGDPYILKDLIIDGGGIEDCITITDSTANFIIKNCTLYNGNGMIGAGITLINVTNGEIIDCNSTDNSYSGIYYEDSSNLKILSNSLSLNYLGILAYYSNYTTISNNDIFDDGYGIYLDNSLNHVVLDNSVHHAITGYGIYLEVSPYNRIEGNEIKGCEGGIEIDHSNHSIIIDNIAENNVYRGIYIFLSYYVDVIGNTFQNNSMSGIYAEGCSFCNISDNISFNNTESGIELIDYFSIQSNESIITNNIVKYNKQVGIFITEGSENQILNNVLLNNTLVGLYINTGSKDNLISGNFLVRNGIYHGVDFGMNNDWNTSSIGNYWDNWTSPDSSPKDGIVDNPYPYIYGPAGSVDHLPIAEDGNPRVTINSPSTDDAFSIVAPNFNITVTDIYWDEIWYTIDGGSQNYSCSELGTFDQSAWNVLSDDHHLFTFYASDIIGNVGSNFVWIAKDTAAPVISINSPTDGATYGNRPPDFNVSFADDHLDSVWYSVDDGVTLFHVDMIYTDLILGTINQTAWSALPEGSATITFYANDTLGHSSSKEVTITKNLPSRIIGMDNFMTSFLITIFSGVAIISVIAKIHFKKRLLSN